LLIGNVKFSLPNPMLETGILKSETCSEVPTFQTGFQKSVSQKQSLETVTVSSLPVSNSLGSSYLPSKYSLYFWSNLNCMHTNVNKNSAENLAIFARKKQSDNNLSCPQSPFSWKKAALAALVLPTTVVILTGLVVLRSPSCSPVSLHLKVGAFEYQLQKGSCNIPHLPSQ
jgi:hypothetical protein